MTSQTPQRRTLDDLVKLDVKIFAAAKTTASADEFIPVFHRWISDKVLPELLIDVADYSHVHHGPGVLLVGHDAIYSYDLRRGEPGLLYSRRRETNRELANIATLDERLLSLLRHALNACDLIEAEPALAGRVEFERQRLELRVNDRLVDDSEDTSAALAVGLRQAMTTTRVVNGSSPPPVERINEPRERLTLRVG